MFVDPSLEDKSAFLNGFKVDELFQDIPLVLPDLPASSPPLPAPPFRDATVVSTNGVCSKHCEIMSDMLLNYITQLLMDEDMEGKTCMYKECSALQVTEKPFYDILGEKYPLSLDHQQFYLAANGKGTHRTKVKDSRQATKVPTIGKYKVDVASFESLALPELQVKEETYLFVVDEVGKMELFSSSFFPAVLQVLESNLSIHSYTKIWL